MKRFVIFILGVLLIMSCSNGLEKQAKEQLKKTMKEMLKNPDSATLTNVKTELNNDSICIIQFTCKAQNGFGGYNSTKYEYVYLKIENKDKTIYKEGVFNLEKTKSVIKKAKDFSNSISNIGNKDIKKSKSPDELEIDSINTIYLIAIGNLIFSGREVDKEEGEEIKL